MVVFNVRIIVAGVARNGVLNTNVFGMNLQAAQILFQDYPHNIENVFWELVHLPRFNRLLFQLFLLLPVYLLLSQRLPCRLYRRPSLQLNPQEVRALRFRHPVGHLLHCRLPLQVLLRRHPPPCDLLHRLLDLRLVQCQRQVRR